MAASEVPLQPYYQDEAVTIYCGDAIEILPLLEADVMVTDPPYGIAWRGTVYDGRAAQAGRSFRDRELARGGIQNDGDTSARDAALVLWGDKPALVFGSPIIPPPAGTKQTLVWQKDPGAGVLGAINGWRRDWEPVYVLGKWPVLPASSSSVFRFDGWRNDAKIIGHPHAKTLPLMQTLIERCPPGVIVDPFMGSGSTLRAAKNIGRRCVGIEIDERWCQVAAERCAQEVLDVA